MTIVLLLWVVCAGFAGLIAHAKGRSVGGFVAAGLLLGVAGLLWAAFARPAGQQPRRQSEQARRAEIAARASQPLGVRNDWRRHLPD
jgi:hypothetical protein